MIKFQNLIQKFFVEIRTINSGIASYNIIVFVVIDFSFGLRSMYFNFQVHVLRYNDFVLIPSKII